MRVLKKELWPYKVQFGKDESSVEITKVEQWLGETMGPFKGRWNAVYQYNSTDFYFRDSDDLLMFQLRWV